MTSLGCGVLVTGLCSVEVFSNDATDESLALETEVAATVPTSHVVVRRTAHVLHATARTLQNVTTRGRIHLERLHNPLVLLKPRKINKHPTICR